MEPQGLPFPTLLSEEKEADARHGQSSANGHSHGHSHGHGHGHSHSHGPPSSSGHGHSHSHRNGHAHSTAAPSSISVAASTPSSSFQGGTELLAPLPASLTSPPRRPLPVANGNHSASHGHSHGNAHGHNNQTNHGHSHGSQSNSHGHSHGGVACNGHGHSHGDADATHYGTPSKMKGFGNELPSSLSHNTDTHHVDVPQASSWSRYKQVISSDSDMRRVFYLIAFLSTLSFVQGSAGVLQSNIDLVINSFHSLFDIFALSCGLSAMYISTSKPDFAYSFGYDRFEVLAGFSNAVYLIFIAMFSIMESTHKMLETDHEYVVFMFLSGSSVSVVVFCSLSFCHTCNTIS